MISFHGWKLGLQLILGWLIYSYFGVEAHTNIIKHKNTTKPQRSLRLTSGGTYLVPLSMLPSSSSETPNNTVKKHRKAHIPSALPPTQLFFY